MKIHVKSGILAAAFAAFAAATTCAESAFDPDCVLYYDFETLDGSGNVVNLANPGTMDGTIVTKSGLAPALVDDSPAAKIRQSLKSATYEVSEKSLENYIAADSRKRGYVECTPTDVDWFAKTNFTIECFFMTTNSTQNYTPLFRRWGGANVQVNVGIGGTAGKLYFQVSTNTAQQVAFGDAQSFTMGEWHHAALVADQTGETKTLFLYLDGKSVASTTLATNITTESVTYGGKWFVAGADGGSSFDGKIDSLRVTLRALETDEFLTTKKFPAGRTLAHVTFDDGTVNADPEGGTLANGVNAAARTGGAAAEFSDDVPGELITDGEGGAVLSKHNKKSLSFSGSKVSWGSSTDRYQDTYYIGRTLTGEKRTSWTVELWVKPREGTPTWGRILTATANGTMHNYYPYALTFNETIKLSLRSQARAGGAADDDAADVKFTNWDFSTVDLFDGKWHHLAFSFAPSAADPEKSEVKFYIDYGQAYSGTTTAKGLIVHPEKLVLCMGNGGNVDYNGLIDEFRISAGALEPSQFLRAEKMPKGIAVIFR